MAKNLVIVESPAKAKTIQKFLGNEYKVMSSFGHIRDLHKKDFSIDVENGFKPLYEIPEDKEEQVKKLKEEADKAELVWLASDEDREGEAIAWHLFEVLGLSPENTRRIVFHEITEPAILEAIKNPRDIDLNLVDAQQARRVLDRIVGFELSPVLWRKIMPGLSAGRVQSVAVRLVAEREKEIKAFKSEPYYRVTAQFAGEQGVEFSAELNRHLKDHDTAMSFLEDCKQASYQVADVTVKPVKRTPAPPFTTSTLQQEAARKLGFSVSQTMMVAQRLYENGFITYMRTDSVNLSKLCLSTSKEEVTKLYGKEYSQTRNFHTKTKGAQEAHEAIRPTDMKSMEINGTAQEKRLYELIWKRTAASQMADAQMEKTTTEILIQHPTFGTMENKFVANGEVITFDGFLKVYRESTEDDENGQEEFSNVLPEMKKGDVLARQEINAIERFSQGPTRYSEASLVHKLEELGIGRPSTYAPTISTIQQREYVQKGEKKSEERTYSIDVLKGNKISSKEKKEMVGSEKGKLLPTDIGTVVNDFLMENFPDIMDYHFTANIEEEFDSIAAGKSEWEKVIKDFYKDFEPEVEGVLKSRSEHKAGEREIGIDPKSGRPIYAKIGRFGPVIQIGAADDSVKPQFAQIPADKSMETITVEEALELFKLPRTLGELEGMPVVVGTGKFGPYIMHNRKFVSLPKNEDPLTVTLETAIELINEKRQQDQERHLKAFENDPKMEILNGRYGPYIAYDGKNYRIPKAMHSKVKELTYEQCMEIIEKMKK